MTNADISLNLTYDVTYLFYSAVQHLLGTLMLTLMCQLSRMFAFIKKSCSCVNTNRISCTYRPPGHHAEVEQPSGFCFFNSAAVGAKYAIHKYGLKR